MVSGTGIIFAVAENFPAPFLSQCPTWDKFSRCLPCRAPFLQLCTSTSSLSSEVLLSFHLFREASSDFSHCSP